MLEETTYNNDLYLNGMDRCDLYVDPMLPCEATRLNPYPSDDVGDWKVQHRSKTSNTGLMVDPIDRRIKVYESGWEHGACYLYRSDPKVERVEDQPGLVVFIGAEGKRHEHHFDFRIIWKDGRKTYVNVKPTSMVTDELMKMLECISEQVDRSLADEIVLIQSTDLPAWLTSRSKLLVSVLRDRENSLDREVGQHIASLTMPITIKALADHLGGCKHAFRPIVRAIQSGRLKQSKPGPINADTVVERNFETVEAAYV